MTNVTPLAMAADADRAWLGVMRPRIDAFLESKGWNFETWTQFGISFDQCIECFEHHLNLDFA